MLFALTRSNLLRQLPDGNGIILRLTEIVTVSNSIGTYYLNCYNPERLSFFISRRIADHGAGPRRRAE